MSVAPKAQHSCQPRLIISLPTCFPFSTSTLKHQRVFSLYSYPPTSHYSLPTSSIQKMGPKNYKSSQNWDEPALVKDLLAAAVSHLNPSKQDILQIAAKAKAMGGWQFTENAC